MNLHRYGMGKIPNERKECQCIAAVQHASLFSVVSLVLCVSMWCILIFSIL